MVLKKMVLTEGAKKGNNYSQDQLSMGGSGSRGEYLPEFVDNPPGKVSLF